MKRIYVTLVFVAAVYAPVLDQIGIDPAHILIGRWQHKMKTGYFLQIA